MREIFRNCAWRSLAVTCGHSSGCRLCAATCGHSSGCKWLQVADFSKIKYRVTCSRRSLAVTCGHSSGCEWLQVADFPKIKYRAACVLNGNFIVSVVSKTSLGYICLYINLYKHSNLASTTKSRMTCSYNPSCCFKKTTYTKLRKTSPATTNH